MKISFITTVFNEEQSIKTFLSSLLSQTKNPQEIIIVDGGSSDKTVEKIKLFAVQIKRNNIALRILVKKGNRSIGRNEAIRHASGDIIVCSDSGNVLDKNWIKNITKPFADQNVDVVAGYYKGKAKNIFQKSLIPYVLVMPDKVNSDKFLPATRSIAFTKNIWIKAGRFNERLSHNEDYAFAQKLKAMNVKIVFAKDAIVHWLPRDTYRQAFYMFYRFAIGDAEAGIMRTTVLNLFARYAFGSYLLFLCLLYKSSLGLSLLGFMMFIYIVWAIRKNYHYVSDKKALVILPIMQFIADFAVIFGTIYGLLKRVRQFYGVNFMVRNRFLLFVTAVYSLVLFIIMYWGMPNANHPFPYHMDEWHQLRAVGTTFTEGTPNVAGSANGTMLYFILSGFYLIPFTLIQYVDPFALQIDNSIVRERIFEVLRLQTIIFGILSMIVLYKIVQRIKASAKIALLLFTFTPVWFVLSGYFKYDIALIFFILLSILGILIYKDNPTNRNLLISSVPIGFAIAIKVSALPLLFVYMLGYFLFKHDTNNSFRYILLGMSVIVVVILLFGLPDTLFGRGNIIYYLYDNIIQTPNVSTSFILNSPPLIYIFTRQLPIIYGYGLYALTIGTFFYWLIKFLHTGIKKSFQSYKNEIFAFLSLTFFIISILPLQVYAGGNRSLVLLPFMVLLIILTIKRLRKISMIVVLISTLCIQFFQTFAWMHIKIDRPPQEVSTELIKRTLPKGTQIGLENIPIYQHVPDSIQKEFYYKEYNPSIPTHFTYTIVSAKTRVLPDTIIITNEEIERKLLTDSPKNDLVARLKKERYKKLFMVKPDLKYYSLFGDEIDFYLANIIPIPLTTSVYQRQSR